MAKQALPPDVREALRLIETISDTIDEVNPSTRAKYADFFESVETKSESIGETIRKLGTVTEKQRIALENMLIGVEKWVR